MTVWEDFEIECTRYLNDIFGEYAVFTRRGGSDSTVSDILVEAKSGASFYIEAKHCPAQCGQFVLLPDYDSRTFQYSSHNVCDINKYAEMIISYMNKRFEEFQDAGTAGVDIDMEDGSAVFSNWIIQSYLDKSTEFIITNDCTILPVGRFNDFFDVRARYRIKRSGSSSVGKSNIEPVVDYITNHDYLVSGYQTYGDKLYVSSDKNLRDERFTLRGLQYMFSLRGETYELRKLSHTNNANVIFSIKNRSSVTGLSVEEFKNILINFHRT